jgi:xylan 1,4-beta-xylosidase
MKSFLFLALLLFTDCMCPSAFAQSSTQPAQTPLTLADPTIFLWQGKYYAFGTNSDNGIPAYTSADLVHWKAIDTNHGFALKKGDGFGTKGFWAPQVFHYKDKFYMAYTANENIAIATSANPYGPFAQSDKRSLPAPVRQIDPFVFIDDDGKKYLYHVRLLNGNRIYGAVLQDDFLGIDTSTLQECISATNQWENTDNAQWPVTEGPTVIKNGGKYYMFYSANDFRNPDYAVGMAASDHPLGPWVKYSNNPVLSRKQTGYNGTGHGDLFTTADGRWHYVFHTHQSATQVGPRKTMLVDITNLNGKFEFEISTMKALVIE